MNILSTLHSPVRHNPVSWFVVVFVYRHPMIFLEPALTELSQHAIDLDFDQHSRIIGIYRLRAYSEKV
jgi:hypothetical protein